jgi:hypothetical protein
MGLTTIRSAKGVAFPFVKATSYPRLQSSDATANWAALWVRCPDLFPLACSGFSSCAQSTSSHDMTPPAFLRCFGRPKMDRTKIARSGCLYRRPSFR